MKHILFTLLFSGVFATAAWPQIAHSNTPGSMDLINSIFDRMELQGVDTKRKLLYGYFFYDKDKLKLEKLKDDLVKQSYHFVEITKHRDNMYMLHVEKVEQLTRQALFSREEGLRQLANAYSVESYDGFDVGNADPAKPLTSNADFARFMATKKGADLFNLGIKLYDLEINENAVTVFKECIRQHIKTDTSFFKLGNILVSLNKIDEGIQQLENAVQINPNYLGAFYNLGVICYDNEKFQKSIDYYTKADRLKPGDDSIVYGIAGSQYALKQFERSLENCKKALQLNPANENAKTLLTMLKGKTK